MSAEIVVGACYRAPIWRTALRVVARDGGLVTAIAVPEDGRALPFQMSEERWRSYDPIRVADPTPAVIDDTEPPLAGELTLRQLAAWAVAQDYDGCPRISMIRIGGEWIVTMTSIRALNMPIEQRQERGSDLQDALTALMSEAS